MDLYHAARAVQAAPPEGRNAACHELLWRAHVADKYLKRLKKLHPFWGDGSLRAAALAGRDSAEGWVMSPDMLACFVIVSRALAQRHRAVNDL